MLEAIPSSDGPTNVSQAVELAKRLLADHANKKIVVLTDGGFPEVEKLAKDKDVQIVGVAAKTPNVAITMFQVRRSLLDPIGYEILTEVANNSEEKVECRLEIDLEDEPVDVVPLNLAPKEKWRQVFEKTSAEGGRLKATINRSDALAADNSAWAILPVREYQNVTLVTPGNLFLEKVLEALPLVKLNVVKEAPKTVAPGTIVIYHRVVPESLPSGRIMVIEPERSSPLWTAGEKLPNPIVSKQDRDSPLMMHVRLDNILMPEARQTGVSFSQGSNSRGLGRWRSALRSDQSGRGASACSDGEPRQKRPPASDGVSDPHHQRHGLLRWGKGGAQGVGSHRFDRGNRTAQASRTIHR